MTADKHESARPRPQGSAGKSPFRYPGGKAFMLPELKAAILASRSEINEYAEPFAGGAGAAIELLAAGTVDRISLNDADPRIFAAWHSIINQTARFAETIESVELSIKKWREMKAIVAQPSQCDDLFKLGFATFFMNRTNRSGIITGAGPIGGYAQEGHWKLSARFYRETVAKRVRWIGEHRNQISLSQLDAKAFIRAYSRAKIKKTFFFIDPPYVKMGGRLYFNSMTENDHRDLANLLKRKTSMGGWLVTYDKAPLIEELYDFASVNDNSLKYSLAQKRTETEFLIKRVI